MGVCGEVLSCRLVLMRVAECVKFCYARAYDLFCYALVSPNFSPGWAAVFVFGFFGPKTPVSFESVIFSFPLPKVPKAFGVMDVFPW